MIKNRFYKTTLGVFAQIFVGKNVAYTTEATYEDFINAAPAGTIGIFNADTGATVTAAVGADTPIFIALQKAVKASGVSAEVKVSTTFTTSELKASKSPYVAGVKNAWRATTAAGATVAAGDILEVLIVETTPSNVESEARFSYSHTVTTGQTLTQAITSLKDRIIADQNNTRINQGDDMVDPTVTETDNLTLTAKELGQSFTLHLRGKLASIAVAEQTAAMIIGSGTPEAMRELEAISFVYDGVTTNQPMHATPADYGAPTSFVDHTQYDMFLFKGQKSADTPIPQSKQFQKNYIMLAVPKTATPFTPSNDVATVFGLTLNS